MWGFSVSNFNFCGQIYYGASGSFPSTIQPTRRETHTTDTKPAQRYLKWPSSSPGLEPKSLAAALGQG